MQTASASIGPQQQPRRQAEITGSVPIGHCSPVPRTHSQSQAAVASRTVVPSSAAFECWPDAAPEPVHHVSSVMYLRALMASPPLIGSLPQLARCVLACHLPLICVACYSVSLTPPPLSFETQLANAMAEDSIHLERQRADDAVLRERQRADDRVRRERELALLTHRRSCLNR